MAQLELKHLNKTYDNGFQAVKDINLEINEGEFVVIVGPSGCGKSTLLRMIAGLETVSGGEIRMEGRDITNAAPKKRDISMVFQSHNLFPNMTVRKNLLLGKSEGGRRVLADEIAPMAEKLGIGEILDKKPGQVSGGQKQRGAIVRSLIRRPKVYLMDEPLSSLDAKLRVQIRNEIARLYHETGSTFIYVTHDQEEAMTLGTKVVAMKAGMIMQVEAPLRMYEKPDNQFVAGFFGVPSMNFLEMKCVKEDGMIHLKRDTFSFTVPEAKAKKLEAAECDGKDVVMGIRSEHITTERRMKTGFHYRTVTAEVEANEWSGAFSSAYFELCGQTFCAGLLRDEQLKVGEESTFCINLDRIHIFDMETGVTISN